jgi:hypothetical protein
VRASTLASLAAVALLGTFWLMFQTMEPGTQLLAAVAAGAAAWITIGLIMAAVRADIRERARQSGGVR